MTSGFRKALALGGALLVLPLTAIVVLRAPPNRDSSTAAPQVSIAEAPLSAPPRPALARDAVPTLGEARRPANGATTAAVRAPPPPELQLDVSLDEGAAPSGPTDVDRPVIADMGSLSRAPANTDAVRP